MDDPKVRLLFRLEELPDLSDLESGTSPSRDNIVGPASSLNVDGMDFGLGDRQVVLTGGARCQNHNENTLQNQQKTS